MEIIIEFIRPAVDVMGPWLTVVMIIGWVWAAVTLGYVCLAVKRMR